MLLGQILIHKKVISSEQLEIAINQQAKNNVKLGELLIKKGLIVNHQLEEALKEQYWRRNGFWIID